MNRILGILDGKLSQYFSPSGRLTELTFIPILFSKQEPLLYYHIREFKGEG